MCDIHFEQYQNVLACGFETRPYRFADELFQVVHGYVSNCCMRHVSLLKILNLHQQDIGVNGCCRTPGITRAHIQCV